MIFQGEEWGASTPFMYFTDHQDPDLIKAVREGRQKEFIEFGWNPEEISDPQDLKTFTSSRLRWEEQSDYPHNKMLDWYKQMISLRKKHKDLSCGNCSNITIDFSEKNKWIHIKRDKMSIICNFSNNVQKIPCKKNNPEIVATSTKGVQLHK